MKKILIAFLVISLIFVNLSTVVMAKENSNVSTADKIMGKGTQIVNAILWFGYAIALGMVVFIGIKYILGSAEAKSNMKSAIVNWFIGAFIVFLCTTIASWVVNLATSGGGASDKGLAGDIINAVGTNGNS